MPDTLVLSFSTYLTRMYSCTFKDDLSNTSTKMMPQKQPIPPEQAASLGQLCVASTALNFVSVNQNGYGISGAERDAILANFMDCCQED